MAAACLYWPLAWLISLNFEKTYVHGQILQKKKRGCRSLTLTVGDVSEYINQVCQGWLSCWSALSKITGCLVTSFNCFCCLAIVENTRQSRVCGQPKHNTCWTPHSESIVPQYLGLICSTLGEFSTRFRNLTAEICSHSNGNKNISEVRR